MAVRTETVTLDDITNEAGARTVSFALDGTNYEIDLGEENIAKLNEDLATWIGHARRVAGKSRAASKPKAASKPAAKATTESAPAAAGSDHDYDPKAVRAWAEANGVKVAPRGRIPAAVVDQYRAAA